MNRNRVRVGTAAVVAAVAVLVAAGVFALNPASTQAADTTSKTKVNAEAKVARARAFKITQAEREAAADRKAKQREAIRLREDATGLSFSASTFAASVVASPPPGQGGIPDMFGAVPNWAYSPLLRKFVDTLPGLGASNKNNLGQYMPVGKPDTITYPGSDYYEIELRQYTEKMHSQLPRTTLRGYVQVNKGTDSNGANTLKPDPIHYLGTFISARKDRPVRIKFTNKLPNGEAGNLFIPVDTSVMGAGKGPVAGKLYTENRATLHLHGGMTPWISDGTPHQWITPAGEDTPYPKGVSVKNVPDMPDPGDGSMTFFYTNAQSARLMFYHDHSYGITRLNVYAGEAGGYMITDKAEEKLIADKVIPSDQIPLILQDKTFVDAETVLKTDPTWNWGTGSLDASSGIRTPKTGDLWLPHVYVPAQNPADMSGMNATGRWHYGPWFWPPIPATAFAHPPIPNPYFDPINAPWEPALMPATPNPSMGMEAFHDTPLVNGTAYPVLNVQPKSYRLRILNAASDRFWNLQMYEANNTKKVVRFGGANRYDVSLASATKAYPLWTGVTDVVVASGQTGAEPDALTAAGLAGALNAPLLLVPKYQLNAQLASAFGAMPDGVKVHIVGGAGSVSTKVRGQIASISKVGSVDRIGGANRYIVAANVAKRMSTELDADFPNTALIVNGNQDSAMFDALTASAISFKMHFPVLLVRDSAVTTTTAAAMSDLGLTKCYIIGGPGSVSSAVQTALHVPNANRIWGMDRYSTATAAANRAIAEGWLTHTYYGISAKLPDAATGGAFMGKMDGAMLYVKNGALAPVTGSQLSTNKDYITGGFVFGGPASVPEAAKADVKKRIELAIKSEIAMVDAVPTAGFPETWPTDGRVGGVPDPGLAGPKWIQIGTEGGFLPAPAIIEHQPISWNRDPTTFNAGNIQDHSLFLGPAERADVVVDFSKYAGKTLILYNDSPAPVPAQDERTDYRTGGADLTDTGGTKTTRIGFGPSTRTVMQIKVAAATPAPAFNLTKLNTAFKSTATKDGVFEASQNPIIVPDARYGSAYNSTTFTVDPFVRIYQNEMTFKTLDSRTVTIPLEPKAIQDETSEVWDYEYGRMSGKLGLEMPRTNATNANFILYSFFDPVTENLQDSMTPLSPVGEDGTQIWKITHNGVDTHPIHFHLQDVQVINRVGWDNAVRPPDDNELGWKDTVRVSPLEDTIVALKPVSPKVPFGVPDSMRPLNPTEPIGSEMGFSNIDPTTGQRYTTPVTNEMTNFGWEYVWHCHILSHEEMDMMRPMKLNVARSAVATPSLAGTGTPGGSIVLRWTDSTPATDPATWGNPANEIGFTIERATVDAGGVESTYTPIGSALANQTSFTDESTVAAVAYRYRIIAFNAAGPINSGTVTVNPVGFFANYTVTPTAFANGSITPSVPETVAAGSDSSTYTIAAATGYHITDVVVDGVSAGAIGAYKIMGVQSDHTIWAFFGQN